jgi:hypothetical protein
MPYPNFAGLIKCNILRLWASPPTLLSQGEEATAKNIAEPSLRSSLQSLPTVRQVRDTLSRPAKRHAWGEGRARRFGLAQTVSVRGEAFRRALCCSTKRYHVQYQTHRYSNSNHPHLNSRVRYSNSNPPYLNSRVRYSNSNPPHLIRNVRYSNSNPPHLNSRVCYSNSNLPHLIRNVR